MLLAAVWCKMLIVLKSERSSHTEWKLAECVVPSSLYTSPYPSPRCADAPCCMRGLKPSPAPIYLGAAFLLVQVNGQGEMDCEWWWQLPLCTSFQLHRIRWGWTEWTSMTVNPEQWLLVNLRRLVCRFSSNYAGKDKCIGVIEADIVLLTVTLLTFSYHKKMETGVCVGFIPKVFNSLTSLTVFCAIPYYGLLCLWSCHL